MKMASAPNKRMETIASHLPQELPARNTDEENMYELLYLLGLSKPDLEGTAVFKKHTLVPDQTLRFYIQSAYRLNHFRSLNLSFKDYSRPYWQKFPKDRIMQLY